MDTLFAKGVLEDAPSLEIMKDYFPWDKDLIHLADKHGESNNFMWFQSFVSHLLYSLEHEFLLVSNLDSVELAFDICSELKLDLVYFKSGYKHFEIVDFVFDSFAPNFQIIDDEMLSDFLEIRKNSHYLSSFIFKIVLEYGGYELKNGEKSHILKKVSVAEKKLNEIKNSLIDSLKADLGYEAATAIVSELIDRKSVV